MATDERMNEVAQAIQALRQENVALTQQVQQLQQGMQAGAGAFAGFGGGARAGDAVEKLLKRTEAFDGNNFQDWKFRVETNLMPVLEEAAKLVKWAENENDPLDDADVMEENFSESTDKAVYYFLTSACKGEAFDIVRNVAGTCGAEAWRKLCKRFGAKTRGRKVVLLRKCVNPPRIKKLTDAPAFIEKWENDVRRLRADYQEGLSDGVKCGILLEMVPSNVTEFMTQRMGEEDTYEDTKEMVLRYVQTKADFGGPSPMDVDGLMEWSSSRSHNHKHQDEEEQEGENPATTLMSLGGKGKGKGGGKGIFQGACNLCGEWGHRAAECPNRNLCFHCWQPGHVISQCPVKDAEMKGQGKGGYKGYVKGGGKGKGWYGGGKGLKGGGKKGTFGKGGLHGCWDDEGHGKETGSEDHEAHGPVWGLFGLEQREDVNEGNTDGWRTAWGKRACRLSASSRGPCHVARPPPGLYDDFGIPAARVNQFQDLTPEDDEEIEERTGKEDSSMRSELPLEMQNRQWITKKPARKETAKRTAENQMVERSGKMFGLFFNDSDLNSLGEKEEWVSIDTVVDSGAADTVAPVDMAPWVPLEASTGSKRGQTWQSACGEVLPNMGERKISGYTEEGEQVQAVYQIAEVSKALGSVSRTCDRGNRVVFEANGGYIENLESGRRTKFHRESNVYIMKTWVKKPASQPTRAAAGFSRQG